MTKRQFIAHYLRMNPSLKIQYSPWDTKKKKKIKLPAPTSPTPFYSPHGVAPNKEKREAENGDAIDDESDIEEEVEDSTPEKDQNPFEDFEQKESEEKDPFDF